VIEEIKNWAGLMALLISLGTTVYAWFTSKSRVNAEHLKAVDAKLAEHSARIAELESEMRHLPAKDDVTELKLSIVKLEGTVGRLDEALSGVSRTVQRIDGYLRKE